MHDTKTAQPQHRGGDGLNRELNVRTNGANIVVQAEQENQTGGYQNGGENPERRPERQFRPKRRNNYGNPQAYDKSSKNSDAAQTWQRRLVQVTFGNWSLYPTPRRSKTADVSGEDE